MTTPYVYHPLDRANDEIRLVDILPNADFDAPIELAITHAPFVVPPEHLLADRREPLSEIWNNTLPEEWYPYTTLDGRYIYCTDVDDACRTSWNHPAGLDFGEPPRLPPTGFQPQFEALSWTWGDQIDTEAARVVDGEGNWSACRLRQNLAEAIRYLRQPSQSRRMWIDSICIDQENKDEQGQQVLRMKDIYRLAQRVVIWLGPAGQDTHLALDALRSLGERVLVTQSDAILDPPEHTGDWRVDALALTAAFSEATWRALDDLLARPWFGRVWTIQECLLANWDSFFQVGNYTIAFDSFQKGCYTLGPCTKYKAPMRMDWCSRAEARIGLRNKTIRKIMLCVMEMTCSDPRDKVYGVLGLMPPNLMGGIQPDYTLTVSKVFEQTLLQHATATRRLELLDHCDLGTKLPDAPSWIPNYTPSHQPWFSQYWSGYRACGYFPSYWTSNVAEGVLDVQGVRRGTVTEVSPILDSEQSMVDFFRRAYEGQIKGVPKGTNLRDYVYACHRGGLEELAPLFNFPTWAMATSELLEMWSGNKLAAGLGWTSRSLRDNWPPVRFLYTDEGLAGLSGCSAKPGDMVVVVPGCRLPKIVRPLSPSPEIQTSSYQLVGSCEIFDLANAEGLLGPLPKGYTVTYFYDSQGEQGAWIVNDETGYCDNGDPRLEPHWHPADWCSRPLSGEGEEKTDGFPLCELVHQTTGERTRSHPACTRETLIARGVKLETFSLR